MKRRLFITALIIAGTCLTAVADDDIKRAEEILTLMEKSCLSGIKKMSVVK